MGSLLLLGESEGEAVATLQDAMAFIDAFKGETAEDGNNVAASAPTKSKRVVTEPGSTSNKKKRSHTERVRDELEQLRNNAQVLEAILKRLKQHSLVRSAKNQLAEHWSPSATSHFDLRSSSLGSDPVMAKWMEILVEEYRLRCESEAMNRRLRAMLATQFNIMQTAEGMLSSKFTGADFAALSESDQSQENQRALAKSLSSRLRQHHLDVDNVLRRTGIAHIDSFIAWSQCKHDENFGVLVESSFCFPVPLDLEQTTKALLSHSACKVVRSMKMMQNDIDSDQLTSATLEHDEQIYELATKTTVRKISENDRIIYVWSALVSLSGTQWAFHEDGITVVRRARTNPPTSVLQNWHRVRVKQQPKSKASSQLKEAVLSVLSNRVRYHLGKFRNSMESIKRAKCC